MSNCQTKILKATCLQEGPNLTYLTLRNRGKEKTDVGENNDEMKVDSAHTARAGNRNTLIAYIIQTVLSQSRQRSLNEYRTLT